MSRFARAAIQKDIDDPLGSEPGIAGTLCRQRILNGIGERLADSRSVIARLPNPSAARLSMSRRVNIRRTRLHMIAPIKTLLNAECLN